MVGGVCGCGAKIQKRGDILSLLTESDGDFHDHTELALDVLAENANTHFWLLARKRWVVRAIRRYLKPSDAFLDVGVGGCDVAEALRREGFKMSLGDIQLRSLEIASDLGFKDLFRFDLYRPVFLDHFKGVGVFDVLEHLDDDETAVKNLLKMVAGGGYIFATVPAFQFLWNNRDRLERHKRRYSRRQLVSLFRRQGAEVVSCGYIFSFIFPLLWMRAVQSRLSPQTDFSADDHRRQFQISLFQNRVLTWVTRLEQKIFQRYSLPFGGSLLIIARKRG